MKKQLPVLVNQEGIALVISMIMLLLMSILGVTAMQTTVLEEKMAGNFKNVNLAFQAAESALKDSENYLSTTSVLPSFNGVSVNGLYPSNTGLWNTIDWSDTSKVRMYTGPAISGVTTAPITIIERIASAGGTNSLEAGATGTAYTYRITARGVGGTGNAVAIVQTIFVW